MKFTTLSGLVLAALVTTSVHAISIQGIRNSLNADITQVCIQTGRAIDAFQLACRQLTLLQGNGRSDVTFGPISSPHRKE